MRFLHGKVKANKGRKDQSIDFESNTRAHYE